MTDLSHWDSFEDFDPNRIASLITTSNPESRDDVLVRMREGYRIARTVLAGIPMTAEQFRIWRKHKLFPHTLVSKQLDGYPMLLQCETDRNWELVRKFRESIGDFDNQRFARTEIHRWLGAVGLKSSYTFESQQKYALPVSPSLEEEMPGPMEESVGVKPPTGWKMKVQKAATLHWKDMRTAGGNPTVSSIVDSMAKWCRENSVLTDGGINPSANYLRTHVLGGKHWMPPR